MLEKKRKLTIKSKRETVTLYARGIDKNLYDKLKEEAFNKRMTVAEALNQLIEGYFNELDNDNKGTR